MNAGIITDDFLMDYALSGSDKPLSWAEIQKYVSSKCKVTNWMLVRSALQMNINDGLIVRTDDLRNEEYVAA